MSKALDEQQIQDALGDLPGWSYEHNRLTRAFEFSSFREAMSFLVRVAFEAEELNHHPEIRNVYSTVEISLTTHDAGNRVTALDIDLAARIQHFSWV